MESEFHFSDIHTDERKRIAREVNDERFSAIFDAKFLEGLEKRRDNAVAKSQKIQIFQLSITLILAVALLSLKLKVSFFSMSTDDVRNLREILLVVAACVQFIALFTSTEVTATRDLMEVVLHKVALGNSEVIKVLKVRYGLSPGFMFPKFEHAEKMKKRHYVVFVCALAGMALPLVIFFASVILVQVFAMADIWSSPSVSKTMSFWVIAFVVLVDLGTIAIAIISARKPDPPAIA